MPIRVPPVAVVAALTARARPKSATLTSPSGVISTFSGLMSRWMRWAAWAAERATSTWESSSSARLGFMGVSSRMRSRSVRPGTYSMTRYVISPSVPWSKTDTTCRWFS